MRIYGRVYVGRFMGYPYFCRRFLGCPTYPPLSNRSSSFIDFCFRKYLKSKGRLEELRELESNKDIPRFRMIAKTPLERKIQAGLLIFILISSGLILLLFF